MLIQSATTLYCFTLRSLTTAHSRERPAPVTTTFSNFITGGRLREFRLYCTIINAVNIFYQFLVVWHFIVITLILFI